MLVVNEIQVKYGAFVALENVSIKIVKGQVVSIVGANGAGKTTLINTISGLLKPTKGEVFFEEKKISQFEGHTISDLGIAQVPEGRKLFSEMTVYENLLMGGYSKHARKYREESLEMVFSLFPQLLKREKQMARTLSGGEQQMLAIGRALMSKPKLLMFDEPSLGLAPKLVQSIFETIVKLKESGLTIMLVEQNVRQSLQISDYAYVLETGQIALDGSGEDVLRSDHTRKAYLGL